MARREEELGELLKQRGWMIAVAEATCGGLICHRIVSVPGSSKYFERGIIAYSRSAKVDLLRVPPETLQTFGAVSAETAAAMAEGVRALSGTQLGLAESGIAGPVRGKSPKPIGACYIALATPEGTQVREFQFAGERLDIMNQIATAALQMVAEYLLSLPTASPSASGPPAGTPEPSRRDAR
ncbi:MAG: CinA family protein [Abditibacteriales bacterium]|nr:CinA family protein [Abditibacteriales bacterium]MDW8365445.1 CinA family protein [Abditibacteriales bacterium]